MFPGGCAPGPAAGTLPFHGGLIGFLSYELGRVIEPAAQSRGPFRQPGVWPLQEVAWCPRGLVYDHARRRWHAVGGPPEFVPAGPPAVPGDFSCGELRSDVDPDRYLEAVGRVIDAIGAGDIFQANVTHRLSCRFRGSTRALACRALACSGAWYGAYLELPGGRSLLSLSPELFLSVGRDRSVITRPIKGTRPSHRPPSELRDSAKDAAELNMIVDLMRNDLGRVCAYGSVRVTQSRTIESHPTVHHGVAEVAGRLRDGTTLGDLVEATFPPGSITGAPKIRAMQIIDELERSPRGPYCGSIGYVSACGRACLNVAIRTIVLEGTRARGGGAWGGAWGGGAWGELDGTLHYGVGGGIVADSDPLAEYRETMDKAAVLRHVLREAATVPLAGRAG